MPSNEDVYIYNNYTAPRLRFLTWVKENPNAKYLGSIHKLNIIFHESQPTEVKKMVDLIVKLNNSIKQDYLNVDE